MGEEEYRAIVARVREHTDVPVAIGFGIGTPEAAAAAARAGADGVIVASALVDALGPEGTDVPRMAALVAALREGTRRA